MSVASLHTVRIVPIARDPAMPKSTPAIIARWLGTHSVVCDGSFGVATITLGMGGIGEIYGSHALWDLRICSIDMDQLPVNVTALSIQVNSYELEGARTMAYTWFPGLNLATFYQGATSTIMSDFKHRSSDVSGFPSNVRLIGINQFPQTWYLYAGGYIYDERLI